MIRRFFAEMADDDTADNQRIQRFIGDGK